jgi:predicted dehydrogenase
MLRIGIVGCGKIADSHVEEIQKLPGCEVVGICDTEIMMAKQLSDRYGIKRYFQECQELLATCTPDVIHITTPPQSHFELAKLSLERGSHVYVEKPFALNLAEAETLIETAHRLGLFITVGHNYQFDPAALVMRKLVNEGVLGGDPIHLESIYCYNLHDEFAKALIGNRSHWVMRLPGKLLQNVISHGICKIVEFMKDNSVEIIARGYTSPGLPKELGDSHIVDELRTSIHSNNTSAYFTFSTQIKPGLHQLRLYGTLSSLVVDYNQQTIIVHENKQYKSYLNRLIPPFALAGKYLSDAVANLIKFLKADFHFNAGMRVLIESFYRCILRGGPPPIPYREILLTTKIMDEIFRQLDSEAMRST